eukprot:403340671
MNIDNHKKADPKLPTMSLRIKAAMHLTISSQAINQQKEKSSSLKLKKLDKQDVKGKPRKNVSKSLRTDKIPDLSSSQAQTSNQNDMKKKSTSTMKIKGLGSLLLMKHQENGQSQGNSSKPGSKMTSNSLSELLVNAIMKKYNFKLTVNDLKTPLLIAIIKKDQTSIKNILKTVYEQIDQQNFQYEVTVAFWLAVHLELLDISKYLIHKVPLLKKIVASVMKKKSDNKLISQISRASRVISRKSQKAQRKRRGGVDSDEGPQSDQDQEDLTGLKINKGKIMNDHEESDSSSEQQDDSGKNKGRMSLKKKTTVRQHPSSDLNNIVPTEIQVNTEAAESLFHNFQDITQLIEVKMVMRQEFPTLMTNILKIVLGKQEQKLAQIIIAYYKTSVTKDILLSAIDTNQYDFLYYMFGFGKNFIYKEHKRMTVQLTFIKFFKYIRRYKTEFDDFKETIKEVCEWKVQNTGDNFLKALLTYDLDDLAITYMGSFGNNLNEHLLIYCLDQQNQKFIKEDSVVEKLLYHLNQGTRTNYILDVLSLIDISVWKNRQIKQIISNPYIELIYRDLMDIFIEFAEVNYEKNQLNLSYNPILTIVLASEILNKISSVRKKFENECKRIVNQLLRLGEMFISKISDDKYYEKLITDVDFQERPVIKIIAKNNFERLMDENDPKAENLMNKIWKGSEATNCDGNIFGYSCLSNVVFRPFKKVLSSGNRENGPMQIASNSFEPNFKVDYMVQHRYRSKGIYFFFIKELLCALAMLIIFQWINYQYLSLISIANGIIDDFEILPDVNGTETIDISTIYNSTHILDPDYMKDEVAEIEEIQSRGNTTINLGYVSYLFSIALIFQLILKITFNFKSAKKIPLDKWTIMDSISAFLNIMAVQVIQNVTLDQLMDGKMKDVMDYFMILVLGFSWIRFFMYFLVVRSISKLLLTLVEMVEDTLSFFFIVSCFIMIMSSIFTTLYQDINPEKFGSLTTTVRTLFDAALAVYSYENMGGRTLSYSILMIFHVFFSNVLLLNYLIAILSTTYENMKQSGIFKYKKNLYQYCERFITCFEERAYGELVLHPPPLSYGCLFLLPFIRNREKMEKYTKVFSIVMFWIENFILIISITLYELALLPFAFLKTLSNIVLYVNAGLFRKLIMIFFWLTLGIFVNIYLLYQDISNLIFILRHYNGFTQNDIYQLQDEQLNINTQIEILNLARDGVIILFKTLKSHFNGNSGSKKRKRGQNRKRSNQPGPSKIVINQDNKESFLEYSEDQSQIDKSVKGDLKSKSSLRVKKSNQNLHSNNNSVTGSSDQDSYDLSDESSDLENFIVENEITNLEQTAGYNPNDQNCLYVVKKFSILEDWKIRRKLQLEQKRVNQKFNLSPSKDEANVSLKNINKNIRAFSVLVPVEEQKLVNDDKIEDEEESNINKGFKSKINQKFAQKRKSKFIFLDSLISQLHQSNRKKLDNTFNVSINNKYTPQQSKTQNLDKSGTVRGLSEFEINPNQAELKCINQFFNNFVIVSESALTEHIDIVMFLRALPDRITLENIHKVNMFNFKIFQESLFAYQNLDLVNPFEYFDEKNRERVQQVKEKLSDQKTNLEQVRDIVKFVKRKMYNHEGLMKNQQDLLTDMNTFTHSQSYQKKITQLTGQNSAQMSQRLGPSVKPQGSTKNLLSMGNMQGAAGRFNQQFMKGSSLTPVADKSSGFFAGSPNSYNYDQNNIQGGKYQKNMKDKRE